MKISGVIVGVTKIKNADGNALRFTVSTDAKIVVYIELNNISEIDYQELSKGFEPSKTFDVEVHPTYALVTPKH